MNDSRHFWVYGGANVRAKDVNTVKETTTQVLVRAGKCGYRGAKGEDETTS